MTKRCNGFTPGSRPSTATSSPKCPSPASPSPKRCSRCCAPTRASTRPPRTTTTGRCRTRTASPGSTSSGPIPTTRRWRSTRCSSPPLSSGPASPGRGTFWRYRRARPLPASLPMTDDERRAMTAGWFLGQIVGRIHIPESPYTDPVRIYDADAGHWLNFPNPLLTPPSAYIATYDWLPAVLESILLAIAQSHEPPVMRSLRPYGVLRALYDAHSPDPASGIVELSAADVLRDFLANGAGAPGMAPRLETIAA